MFQVKVNVGGKVVRCERIETMPELKSFAYGIMLSPAVADIRCEQTGGMIMVDQDGPRNYCTGFPEDKNLLRKFKKSHYATL